MAVAAHGHRAVDRKADRSRRFLDRLRYSVHRTRPHLAANAAAAVDRTRRQTKPRRNACWPGCRIRMRSSPTPSPRRRSLLGSTWSRMAASRKSTTKAGFDVVGARDENPWRFVNIFREAITVLPELQQAAKGNGFVNEPSDWDNVVRHVPLVFGWADKPVPSLAAEAMRVGFGAKSFIARYAGAQAEKTFGGVNSGLNAIQIQVPDTDTAIEIAVDGKGQVAIHYARRDPRRYISASDILDGNFDPKRIADHIVLVGSSAAGLNDLKATPIAPDMPGVEVHAQLIEQILAQDFLFRPDWAPGAEIIFALCRRRAADHLGTAARRACPSAIFGGIAMHDRDRDLLVRLSPRPGADRPGLSDTVLVVTSSLQHAAQPPTDRAAAARDPRGLLALSVAALRRGAGEQPREAGARRRNPADDDHVLRHPRLHDAVGRPERRMIWGSLINDFLTPMTEIVMEHKGTIDKYIGDCIMAFWNAPLDDPDHARNAVAAAKEMRSRLVELNQAWQARGRRTTEHRHRHQYRRMQRRQFRLAPEVQLFAARRPGEPVVAAGRPDQDVRGRPDHRRGHRRTARRPGPDRTRPRRGQGQDAGGAHLHPAAASDRGAAIPGAPRRAARRLSPARLAGGARPARRPGALRQRARWPGSTACSASGSRRCRSSSRRPTGTASLSRTKNSRRSPPAAQLYDQWQNPHTPARTTIIADF